MSHTPTPMTVRYLMKRLAEFGEDREISVGYWNGGQLVASPLGDVADAEDGTLRLDDQSVVAAATAVTSISSLPDELALVKQIQNEKRLSK